MALLLNIETATTVCSVSLALDGVVVACKEQNGEYTHAENLTLFIDEVLKKNNTTFKDLDAIAISKGPGSYTGLRIGVSVAKGLCYALNKPLIAVDTLHYFAHQVSSNKLYFDENALYCPMIDARRMEVYCAVYDCNNNERMPVSAEIIDEGSFDEFLNKNKVCFFGNGANKCKQVLLKNKNAVFIDDLELSSQSMAGVSYTKFKDKVFEDVYYFEPYYLKDFFIKKSVK